MSFTSNEMSHSMHSQCDSVKEVNMSTLHCRFLEHSGKQELVREGEVTVHSVIGTERFESVKVLLY